MQGMLLPLHIKEALDSAPYLTLTFWECFAEKTHPQFCKTLLKGGPTFQRSRKPAYANVVPTKYLIFYYLQSNIIHLFISS